MLDGFEQIRKNGAKGEIYHIGTDDEEISIEDVAQLIFDKISTRILISIE